MRLILILIVLGICAVVVIPSFASPDYAKKQIIHNQETTQSISHEKIMSITDEFMEILVQDTDENYRVKAYNDKASLVQAFENISTTEVATPYIDTYYYEENGGLYIIPTETPPWFNKQNDYDVLQLEENKFLVKQENQSELYGDYGISLEFTLLNQEWKITKITHH